MKHPTRVAFIGLAFVVATACVGSGKAASTADLGPLPPGLSVVAESTSGCRNGESGFDYHFVVIGGTTELVTSSPLLTALRTNGFSYSGSVRDDLSWTSVSYQKSSHTLRAEIGLLSRYLAHPTTHEGPDPASLPVEVRDHADQYLLVALRPTDFNCSTPL